MFYMCGEFVNSNSKNISQRKDNLILIITKVVNAKSYCYFYINNRGSLQIIPILLTWLYVYDVIYMIYIQKY